jgi:glycosyltransferase involved in cell wall biosynthesis
MKILFITYMFPPFNSIGAVRTGKTAKLLNELGNDVRIISCSNQTLSQNFPLEIAEQNIQHTNWINVNSPIEFILGGKKKVATKGYLPSSNHLPNWIQKIGYLYRHLVNFPDGQIGWYPFAMKAGNRLISSWLPDLIFASASPFTTLLIASALSRKHNIPWIAELRDLWSDNHNFIGPTWRQLLERKLESRTLKSACGLVTVSEPLKETLNSKYSIPCKVITNAFDPEDTPISKGIPFSNGIVKIVYTGQVYSHEQNPSNLFLALQQMGNDKEKFRIHFYGRHLSFAQQLAIWHNVSHLIQIHESVSHKESLSLQAGSDILLLLPGQSPAWKGVYTGKLFEYLGARRPILCIGNTNGVAANLIRERKAGVVLNEPEQISLQLQQWVKEKNENGEIPFLPSDVGKGFTRKEQTQKLIEFFETCLKNPVST